MSILEFNWSADTKVKRAKMICTDYLPLLKNRVNMLSASGGIGKTFISLIASLHYLRDHQFSKVYMWCSEDEAGEMKGREVAVVNQYRDIGIDLSDVSARMCYGHTSGKLTEKRGGSLHKSEYFMKARRELHDFDFIVIDPLLNFFGGDNENDNLHARFFMMALNEWAYEDSKTIVLIHHGRKEDGTTRGASAFQDSCRIAYELTKESSGEVSVKLSKTNYTGSMNKLSLKPIPEKVYWVEDERPSDVVTLTYSDHTSERYFPVTIPFSRVAGLTRSKFMYSASTYRDDYRAARNAEQGQTIFILDVDEGMTLDDAKERFRDYRAIIATTRNHQQEKNGITCDRFRVIMQCETPILLDEEEYGLMMDEAIAYFGTDEKCRDISRMYFGNPDAEVYEIDGRNLLDWQIFHKRAQSRKRHEELVYEKIREQNPTPEGMMKSYQTMFEQWFVKGNRNHALNCIRHYAERDGVHDPNEVIRALNALAGLSALPESEMKLLTRNRNN